MGESERLAVVETEVKNVKEIVNKINDKLDSFVGHFASTDDINELSKRVEKLETRNGWKTTAMWVGLVTSMIVNVLLVYRMFTGGN